jgi:hypothetical protein
MAHDEILELCRLITMERDSEKLIPKFEKLRALLAKEQLRLQTEIDKSRSNTNAI